MSLRDQIAKEYLSIKGRHFSGSKGSKKAPKQSAPKPAPEAPNTLFSKTTGRIVDVISEGEIEGLITNDGQSIFVDDTALQNDDGSYNFDGIVWTLRKGTADQESISGFPAVENEIEVGTEVKNSNPVVRTISDSNIDAVRIKIRLPQLFYQSQTQGNLTENSVEFQIEVKPNGGSYELAEFENVTNPIVISGKTTSAYEEAYRINLPAGGAPWDIKITRNTADSEFAYDVNSIFFSTYTTIIDAKFSYPDTAHVGIEVDASLFGNELPSRFYEVDGILCSIPSNYNPVTRVYTGTWDGTFDTAWTNNPVWVLYEMLVNDRWGLGESITASEIDKFALYDIGVYCDELVDDGYGGKESRFTFNAVLSTQREAYDVINAVVSCFRGMAYWSSGTVNVTQDSPADPVKLVTNANVIDGQFEYSGTSLKSRHTAALVSWNDPSDGYKSAIAVVEDPELINIYGWRQVDVAAYGCTSRGQATRFGRWILDSEKNETETVKYEAGLDHADVRPGDIILIADRDYAGVRAGGRVASITETTDETTVTIDSSYTFESGETYTMSCILPDGSIESLDILNSAGAATDIDLDGTFTSTPINGSMFVITASDLSPRKFRVTAVREVETHRFEITALYHDPNKYDRVENDLVVEDTIFSAVQTGPLSPPGDFGFEEYLYKIGPAVKAGMTVSWEPSQDSRTQYYNLEYIPPAANSNIVQDWKFLTTTTGTSYDISDVATGLYQFRVRAVDGLGGVRSTGTTGSYEVSGLFEPPDDVENFNISIVGSNAFLSWNEVTNLDLNHYQVRFSPALTGVTWNGAQTLINQVSKDATGVSVQARVGTYLIKAVDSSGVESVNATSIVTNVQQIIDLNVVETIEEHLTWGGTAVDCTILSNQLQLVGVDTVDDWPDVDAVANWDIGVSGVTDEGYYYFENTLDLGSEFTSRLTASMTVFGTDLYSNVDLWSNVDDVEDWDGGSVGQWDATIEVRTTSDDPDATLAEWSAWSPLLLADYTARGFQFRIHLESFQDGISPIVTEATIQVDMPDRVDGDNDVATTSGTKSVVFTYPFNVTPAIVVSAQSLNTGDYHVITSQSASGFTISFYDSGDNLVDKTFDWAAKGYGKQTA